MSEKRIGIEDARKNLGELATETHTGTDIILTRRGHPIARLTAYKEASVPVDVIAPISDASRTHIAALVERHIEQEYAADKAAALVAVRNARSLANGSVQADIHDAYVAEFGSDDRLWGYADSITRSLALEGLESRRCQCHTINQICTHGIDARCAGHYEADVPPLDGALLCGNCHVALYQARGYTS